MSHLNALTDAAFTDSTQKCMYYGPCSVTINGVELQAGAVDLKPDLSTDEEVPSWITTITSSSLRCFGVEVTITLLFEIRRRLIYLEPNLDILSGAA